MDYIEVSFEITPYTEQNAEIVMANVQELGFESFVTEEPYLKGYIPQESYSSQNLRCLLSLFRNADSDFEVSYTANLIRQENWNRVWESEFRPIVIGGECTVKAPFHKGVPKSAYNITINPEMAFGTGHHQTTWLMVKWLLRLGKLRAEVLGLDSGRPTLKGMQVLDMGTGTGILAMLAARMGAKRDVHAIDTDITAVNSAKENVYKNRLHRAVTVIYGDSSVIQASKYDLILANINRNVLLQDMETYSRGLKSAALTRFEASNGMKRVNLRNEFAYGGMLILSGFYTEDIPLLRKRATECGLKYLSARTKENWAAICLAKL